MRFKYYLRGAGLGILFSTVIMMVAFHTHGNHISEEEVVKRAGELGMVWADDEPAYSSEEIDTQTEPQTESQAKPEAETETKPEAETETEPEAETETEPEAETETEPEAETQSETQSESETESESERQTPPNTAQQGDDSSVTITVVKGEVCRTLAEDLAKAGLVADAEEFRVYMGDHNYASFIHVGEFEIPRGSTYEEIAQILIE